jgi:hypothetical protein
MFQLDSILYVELPDTREFCFFELPLSNPVGGADHLLGQEREPTLDLVEPGGVDWRVMDMGARSRREQVLDFRVFVGGVVEQYLRPVRGDKDALDRSGSIRLITTWCSPRQEVANWGPASARAVVPLGPGYALPSFIRRVRSWGQPCYNPFLSRNEPWPSPAIT